MSLMTMTAIDPLEDLWTWDEFAPPCEAHGIRCANYAVAVMVFKRVCACFLGRPKMCDPCLRDTLEGLESVPPEVRYIACLFCHTPVEFITWYYF